MLATNRIAKSDVRHDAVAEKGIDPMAGAVEELVGDDEVERLVLFLQRTDRRDRNDALHAELLETVDVGAKVQFAGQHLVAASVPRQKCDLAAFESPQNVSVRRIAEGCFQAHFVCVGEAGHGIKPTAPDNADFCL